MNDILQLFPEGVAQGEAFVNREAERNFLINRIKNKKHTVLLAPRRYGKTSLVLKVAGEMAIPHCAIDLLAAYSEEYVRDQIMDKVGRLVFSLLPRPKQAVENLINIFKQMSPEISIGAFGQKLSLSLSNNPFKDITDLLLRLDETAVHFKKSAVIFLDEFQQISQLKNYHSIEASIRHAAERSKNIAYVFSGSNRQLLQQMFGDAGRPLYRLCQMLSIERMHPGVYRQHLCDLAKARWKKPLVDDMLEKIFQLTELHPFYMNVLCQLLWKQNTIPAKDTADRLWDHYVQTQRQIISHDIMQLSINQRRLITALAHAPVKEIQAIGFITQLKISASSTQQALEVLLEKDLVYRDENAFYRVLDPAMRYYLDVVLWDNKGGTL